MAINRIKEVLSEQGIKELTPNEEQLHTMGTTLVSWNKWVAKKKDPDTHQLPAIASFLRCDIEELLDHQTLSKAS